LINYLKTDLDIYWKVVNVLYNEVEKIF